MEENFVALDIGSSRVSAVMAGRDSFGKIQVSAVTSSACNGVKKAIIVDAEKTKDAVLTCKRNLEAISGKTVSSAYISIPIGLCRVIKYRGTMFLSENTISISQDEIVDHVRKAKNINIPENEEIVDIIPVKVIIGDESISSHYSTTKNKVEIDTEILTTDKLMLIELLKSVEKAGLEIERVVASPLALEALIKEDKNDESFDAFIDVGAETIDVSVINNKNICYRKLISLGGNNITNDIANCLNLTFEEAEKLKLSQNSSVETLNSEDEEQKPFNIEFLKEIIDARVEELISISIETLKKSGKYNDIENVYFTGLGIEDYKENLKGYKEKLNKNIEVLNINIPKINSSIYYIPTGIIEFVSKEFEYKRTSTENFLSEDEEVKENKGFVSRIKHYFDDLFK